MATNYLKKTFRVLRKLGALGHSKKLNVFGMHPLIISTFFIVLTEVLAGALRRLIKRVTKDTFLRILLLEFVATAELCATCFELIIVADNYGVWTYALYLFLLTLWWSKNWECESACPYSALEEVFEGNYKILQALFLIFAQVLGGLAVFKYINLLWSLELVETHKGRSEEDCTADLQTSTRGPNLAVAMDILFMLSYVSVAFGMSTIEHLELVMPRYAVRGGDVILKCEHDVPPEQLYKVEWRKERMKIFRYIKGRSPPFVLFEIQGAELVKHNSSAEQIQLSNLDFSASGAYTCEVSMETPIFSKESDPRMLTVIEPQEQDPVISFTKPTYEIGEVLEANCTTGPSRPAPHITWLINNQKVNDSLTKFYSNGRVLGHGYYDYRASATKQLSVEVSELHVGEDGFITLTCLSTIPGYVSHNEDYADSRRSTALIDIKITEVPAEAIWNGETASSTPLLYSFVLLLLTSFTLLIVEA